MVSPWLLALGLAIAPPDSAGDESLPTFVREEAEADGAFDGEYVSEEKTPALAPAGFTPWSRGRIAWIGGARSLTAAAGARRIRAEILLAREDGEARGIDDAYGALAFAATPRTLVRAGWFEPHVGAGLIIGPRRVTPEAVGSVLSPGRARAASGPWFAAPLSAAPARAVTGQRGVAIEHGHGAWRLGALAAATPREARVSGAALRPLLGVRHRNAAEEERRGALTEHTLALAVAFAPPGQPALRAWAVALVARTDPRRAPYEGNAAAAESAATIGRGGGAFELGATWARGGDALLVAAAFDAKGRARTRVTASTTVRALPGGARMRSGFILETEARGFIPPRALPERRPRAHAGVLFERSGAHAWALEAHATDRGPFADPRAWLVARVEPVPGLRLDLRHDVRPWRTLLAVRTTTGPLAAGAEARFDPAGLARRSGWIAVQGRLGVGVLGRLETRLGGGRSAPVYLDSDRPGGMLVRPGRAAARTRVELARPGRVEPRLAWTQLATAEGRSSEVRLAVHWFVGPFPGLPEDSPID